MTRTAAVMQRMLSIGLRPAGRRVDQDLCTGSAGIVVALQHSSSLLTGRPLAALALGLHPGCLMDALAVLASAICRKL